MKRLYVLTRKDLGLAYQAVQGAHAVAQFCIDYPDHEWNNGYLIFLEFEDYGDLMEEEGFLDFDNNTKSKEKKIPFSSFRESDLNEQLTAIAVYTNGNKFKKVPMMGSEVSGPFMEQGTLEKPKSASIRMIKRVKRKLKGRAGIPKKPTPAPIRKIKEGSSKPSGT